MDEGPLDAALFWSVERSGFVASLDGEVGPGGAFAGLRAVSPAVAGAFEAASEIL
jgi:hypothetical protein